MRLGTQLLGFAWAPFALQRMNEMLQSPLQVKSSSTLNCRMSDAIFQPFLSGLPVKPFKPNWQPWEQRMLQFVVADELLYAGP